MLYTHLSLGSFRLLNGDFLVLEDNPLADGFRRASVEANSDFWSQRCIVELVRPKKELPEEATAYYEINYGGRCLDDNTNETGKKHEFQNHSIANGDIYYRSVPVNIQKYVDNAFVRVVNGTTSLDRSYSNFESIYLETEGWTDFFVSKERNYGRVHFVNPKEAETTRPSSISFSFVLFLINCFKSFALRFSISPISNILSIYFSSRSTIILAA